MSAPPAKPTFRAYPSLHPNRSAATVAATLLNVAAEAKQPTGVLAVATPKIHGSNVQLHYAPATGVTFGRRTAFLSRTEEHYGATLASAELDVGTKMAALYAGLQATRPNLTAVVVYGEVYGGWYPHPDVPAAAKSRKPVQKGVWYTTTITIVGFDVCLEFEGGATTFLDYDDARAVCAHVGIPFIPVACRGPVLEVCEWAVAHASDNALQYYNPQALPLIEGNGGEGFVVRLVKEAATSEARALAKIKSPTFSEVATGPDHSAGASASASACAGKSADWLAGDAVAQRFLNANRMAAVASKMAEADVHPKNIKMLADALATDALADPTITAAEVAAASTTEGARAFKSTAFAVTRAFLVSH